MNRLLTVMMLASLVLVGCTEGRDGASAGGEQELPSAELRAFAVQVCEIQAAGYADNLRVLAEQSKTIEGDDFQARVVAVELLLTSISSRSSADVRAFSELTPPASEQEFFDLLRKTGSELESDFKELGERARATTDNATLDLVFEAAIDALNTGTTVEDAFAAASPEFARALRQEEACESLF